MTEWKTGFGTVFCSVEHKDEYIS